MPLKSYMLHLLIQNMAPQRGQSPMGTPTPPYSRVTRKVGKLSRYGLDDRTSILGKISLCFYYVMGSDRVVMG